MRCCSQNWLSSGKTQVEQGGTWLVGRENPSTKDIPGFWSVAARDKKIPLHFVRRDFVSLAILYFCLVRCQIKNEPGANHYSYGPVAET